MRPEGFLSHVVDSLSTAGLDGIAVISSRSSSSFGDAEVLLSIGHIALRCIRDRGVDSVEIGPSHLDGVYHLLEDIDIALAWGEGLWAKGGAVAISEYAQVIRRHRRELEAVFAESEYEKRVAALRGPESRRREHWTSNVRS